jgi:hypothetical protein
LRITSATTIPQIGTVVQLGDWHHVGPFGNIPVNRLFQRAFGPEGKAIDLEATFEHEGQQLRWTPQPRWADGLSVVDASVMPTIATCIASSSSKPTQRTSMRDAFVASRI